MTQAVDESKLTVLSGNVHPLATRSADRGAVDPSMPAQRMLLLLRRSPDQERALRATIESMNDRNSPNFHKWLTPEQFGAQWGAVDSDIAAVTAWLQSHGFTVSGPSAGRTVIEFSGTAGEIQEAFHTSIHTYLVTNGKGVEELHHANATDPEIPAALAPIVAGITTLNDFRPKSMLKRGPRGIYDIKTHRGRPESMVHPDLTAFGSNFDYLYVGPADAATIYDTPVPALNPNYKASTIDGTGSTIGIVGVATIDGTQNANYRKLFGLAARPPEVIVDGGVQPGTADSDAVLEAYLDTEVSNGLAPGAKLYYYTAADTATDDGLTLAILRAVNDNLVDVLSVSFGQCEAQLGTSANEYYESIWQQAAAQGMSVTVSAGDSGSAGCDDFDSQEEAKYGLQVSGLATTPYNIAVGGTDFPDLVTNFTEFVSTTNDPTTLGSALGYIPETPWNDSSETFPPGPLSSNLAQQSPYRNIVSASGGKSNCAKGGLDSNGNPVCQAGYYKPSWQSAPGVPTDGVRDIPDVSLFSADGYFYASWGICTDIDTDSNGNPITDCTPGSNGLPDHEFYITGVGGTSASAPAMAGILALVKQATGQRQGQADYVFYNLARTNPALFHDVTTGNNSVGCDKGTLNCVRDAAGAYFLTGYNAGPGYDLASGLGSVDAAAMIANWASAGLAASKTSLSVAPTSIEHGQVVVADATVTGGTSPAVGNVSLTAEANPPSFPLGGSVGNYPLKSNGSTGSLKLNSLPGGTYDLVATYGGSPELTSSVSPPVAMTVTPEPSIVLLTGTADAPDNGPAAPTGKYPYGFQLSFTAQPYGKNSPVVNGVVQPDGIATGTVVFSIDGAAEGKANLNLEGIATSSTFLLKGGEHTVVATYRGDSSLDPSSTTDVITVSKAVTQLSMTVSTKIYAGTPITFSMKLTTDSGGVAPTGLVEIRSGSKVVATTKLNGTGAGEVTLASGEASVSTSDVPPGNNELNAVYLGDENYAGSSSNRIDVRGRPTFVIADTYLALSGEHTTAAGYIPVTSEGGYTGKVNLTCHLEGNPRTATPPECAMYPAFTDLSRGGTSRPQILIFGIGTKLPSGISQSSNAKWLATGGAVLAFCVLFGVPARRRGWRAMLAAILLLAALGGMSACVTTPKMISAGHYTFVVTGTDSVDTTNTATGTVTVVVN